ncbi:MAG: Smr/MutS family protein [Acidithiobacillus sp.]|uniref:Smr/MutS family protein n=1 Tax=Acidithiobacillus sp. TaxID=1872118 RepID=UPI003CFF1FC0
MNETRPSTLPLDGILDLHAFRPREVPDLVREYLRSCRRQGITQIRIIHGKGKGVQREIVHAILRQEPAVAAFRLANDRSGWGATLVDLYPPGRIPAQKPPKSEVPPPAPPRRPPLWYRLLQQIFVKKG